MSKQPVYLFQRGETILMAIDINAGDGDAVTIISADLRKLAPGRMGLERTAPVAASFTLTQRAAVGDVAAGWDAEISADDCLALTSGLYMTDVRMTIGGKVVVDDPICIQITEPATLPAA